MSRKISLFSLFLVFILALSACRSASPEPAVTTPVPATSVATLPTDTPAPSPTPTPVSPWVALIAPAGSDPDLSGAVQSQLAKLAAGAGLRLQVLPSLALGDLDGSLKAVVALPPDPGIATLAAAAPGTRFLAVDIEGLPAAENLSVVGAGGASPDQLGFLAGYIAAVITKDWRVGMIAQADDPAGGAAKQGFINGVVYFCGLCRPAYPPFYEYPQVVEIPGGAGQAEQQGAADYMVDHGVQTVFVAPGAGDETLLAALGKAGVNVIGGVPRPAGMQNHWVATLHTDLLAAVSEALPGLLGEQVSVPQRLPLIISDANADLFSPGRQLLVTNMLADLQAGYISTGSAPELGSTPTP